MKTSRSSMIASLTHDQLTWLRLARGDGLPPNPFERAETRFQDRRLLLTLRLVEWQTATLRLTPLGTAYLARVEAEQLRAQSTASSGMEAGRSGVR